MQTVRLLQAAALMLVAALAASCAASKEYTNKLFAPRATAEKENAKAALRFLETDSTELNSADWVTTDIIMGRDTTNSTATLDNFSKLYPAVAVTKEKADSAVLTKENKDVMAKTSPEPGVPLAKSTTINGVRQKKSREE